MSAGIGRLGAITGPIMGGVLVNMGIAYPWGFIAFTVVGVLGAVAMSGMQTKRFDRDGKATKAQPEPEVEKVS